MRAQQTQSRLDEIVVTAQRRVTNRTADQKYKVALWGNNLSDERYINGDFDARNVWGHDFSSVGRSREVGASLNMEF